jgi:succinoglycan biosynthesis protein ExoA
MLTAAVAPAQPRISVVLPCLDEEPFVRGAIDSLRHGTYDAAPIEILVVDGGSSDRTREIVAEIAAGDARVRLLENPRRTTPIALNIGIRAARGEIIVRADAHTQYPPNYIEVLVRALEESGADLVGCGEEAAPAEDRLIPLAIALALGGRFATGSPYRYRRQSGPADTVSFGCWRRALFDRVGPFDERLLRNQDYEHARRIRRTGGYVYLTTDTKIRYYPRRTLRKLWRQAAQTGMWNAFTHRLHPYTFTWRHFLPGLFFAGTLLALALVAVGVTAGPRALVWLGAALWAPYALVNLCASTAHAASQGRAALAPLVAAVVASHHFAYGYGICKGWLLVLSGRWRRLLGTPVIAGELP